MKQYYMKAMKEMKKKRNKSYAVLEDDLEEDELEKGLTGFRGLHALRKRFNSVPRRVRAEYRDWVKEELGVVSAQQHWKYRDHSRRLLALFGKMKGLWRVDHALCEVLEFAEAGEADKALAFVVQLRKALHQVALDGGSWEVAARLLPSKDPLGRSTFGGSELEMDAIHRYNKAWKEVQSKTKGASGTDVDDNDGPKETAKERKRRLWLEKQERKKKGEEDKGD